MNLKYKNILITGGSGTLGYNLTKKLLKQKSETKMHIRLIPILAKTNPKQEKSTLQKKSMSRRKSRAGSTDMKLTTLLLNKKKPVQKKTTKLIKLMLK